MSYRPQGPGCQVGANVGREDWMPCKCNEPVAWSVVIYRDIQTQACDRHRKLLENVFGAELIKKAIH